MRILLVEDNQAVARFILKGLREEAYAVDHVDNGTDAIAPLLSGDYDLAVLDVMLPYLDGFSLTERVRKQGATLPILMLTARDSVGDKIEGLDRGADDYLTKPFSFDEFVARIRALLRRGDALTPTKLIVADLVMDPARHKVMRGGRDIELTAREYALLEYLLRNRNRILTRTSILEHVWDIHFDNDSNVIDVYIRYLRRKIDDDFSQKLIHTVRGVGYTLRET